jgi:poly(hydroxyalkanoate) granule-associated protein
MHKDPDFDDTARQIWQSGLDALARAQAQGSQVLDALVQEGLAMQRRTQAMASSVAEQAQAALNQKLGNPFTEPLRDTLGQPWSRLESLFEERVARTLQRLGLPTAQELQALQDRVAQLEARLAADKASRRKPAQPAQAGTRPGKSQKTSAQPSR